MKAYHHKDKGIGMMYDDIFLINGARTPFGKFCGTLSDVSPTDLGIYASRGAIERSGLQPDDIDQAIIANIGQASGDAYFVGRHIGLYSGLPVSVPEIMVQRICASGLETVITGTEQITLGKADAALCCGTENMTLAPTVSFGNRRGYHLGRIQFQDMLWVALDDTAAGYSMGATAENLAEKHGFTREAVDEFAELSQKRAAHAIGEGWFAEEIVPMNSTVFEAEGLEPRKVRLPRKVQDFTTDENVRPTNLESLAGLPPAFKKDGVQTAGNSSGIVDGAAAVTVGSGDFIQRKKVKPLAKIVASASAGVDPKFMGIGPVPAIEILLEMTGLSLDEVDLVEINEAFGAQLMACEKELNIPREKLNVNGGAIALGHPLGATGARLALTISNEMKRRNARYGIASACIGGGQGTALLLENHLN